MKKIVLLAMVAGLLIASISYADESWEAEGQAKAIAVSMETQGYIVQLVYQNGWYIISAMSPQMEGRQKENLVICVATWQAVSIPLTKEGK